MTVHGVKIYRTYAIRLAAGQIPPGYVLEKDLPRRVRDDVNGTQMDALFKHIGMYYNVIIIIINFAAVEGDFKEVDRNDISITNRLGIGEFGPLFDAEVKIDINDIQRAMIKVRVINVRDQHIPQKLSTQYCYNHVTTFLLATW